MENKEISKLEYFSGLAMQSLIIQGSIKNEKILAIQAICYAEELMVQLEEFYEELED